VDTSTTKRHQPLLQDLLLGVGYGHTVYESANKETKTTPGIGVSFALPTSLASQGQGKYLTLGLSANLIQSIGLAGSKSDWFPDVLAFGSVGYSHLFSNSTVGWNSGAPAQYPRQVVGAGTAGDVASAEIFDQQLSAGFLAHDKVALNFTYYLSIYKDLSLGNTWGVQMPFKYQGSATTVTNLGTGPVMLGPSVTALNPVTTFDVSLSYVLFESARVDLGYENVTPELNDNTGQRNSVFYSIGGSVFYGNVALYIDHFIDKAMNPPEKKAALSLGRFHPFQN
jgi:hypothetical protein